MFHETLEGAALDVRTSDPASTQTKPPPAPYCPPGDHPEHMSTIGRFSFCHAPGPIQEPECRLRAASPLGSHIVEEHQPGVPTSGLRRQPSPPRLNVRSPRLHARRSRIVDIAAGGRNTSRPAHEPTIPGR